MPPGAPSLQQVRELAVHTWQLVLWEYFHHGDGQVTHTHTHTHTAEPGISQQAPLGPRAGWAESIAHHWEWGWGPVLVTARLTSRASGGLDELVAVIPGRQWQPPG